MLLVASVNDTRIKEALRRFGWPDTPERRAAIIGALLAEHAIENNLRPSRILDMRRARGCVLPPSAASAAPPPTRRGNMSLVASVDDTRIKEALVLFGWPDTPERRAAIKSALLAEHAIENDLRPSDILKMRRARGCVLPPSAAPSAAP